MVTFLEAAVKEELKLSSVYILARLRPDFYYAVELYLHFYDMWVIDTDKNHSFVKLFATRTDFSV